MSDSSTNSKRNRYNFQYFDQESDFGVENENGERIRKRKRPGRKSNPPSPQERRAQNRAAQKAFREREQIKKREKEEQWQEHTEEIHRLRQRLAEVEYEANYLRGSLLQLTLAYLNERGSIPLIWHDSRIFPPSRTNLDEVLEVPRILKSVLQEDKHQILEFDQAKKVVDYRESCPFVHQAFAEMCNASTTACNCKTPEDLLNTDFMPMSVNSQDVRTAFPKPRSNQAQKKSLHPTPKLDQSTTNTDLSSPLPKPIKGTIIEPPALKTPDDLTHMPPLQALHILRLQLKMGSILGNLTALALWPTALQRLIPHDVRIDYIPSAYLRDRMILFQEFYDLDDCFQLLTTETLFLGGDIRDNRNWVMPKSFTDKFWFFSHELVDHSFDDCHIPYEKMNNIITCHIKEEEQQEEEEQNKNEKQTAIQQVCYAPEQQFGRASFAVDSRLAHTFLDDNFVYIS